MHVPPKAVGASVALAALAVLAAGRAEAKPVVVATQPGLVRQVVVGNGYTAWTRCRTRRGPTDVFVVRGRGKPRRIGALTRRGACDPQRLLGIASRRLLVQIPTRSREQILAVPLPRGRRQVVAQSTPGADGLEIVSAAASGRRVAWIQVTGPADARVAEVVTHDLRFPTAPPTVVYRRELAPEAVEPTGVWISPSGRVAFRERLRGAQYGYGSGRDRLRVVLPGGTLREMAQSAGPVRIVDASISGRWLTYSVAREGDRRVWIYARDLQKGTKRRLRVVRAAPPRLPLEQPIVPTPLTVGSRTVWRERVRRGRRFVDTIRSARALKTRRRAVERKLDVRGQRLFQSPPALAGRVATWAIVEYRRSAGWRGGYAGLGSPRARSRIVRQRV